MEFQNFQKNAPMCFAPYLPIHYLPFLYQKRLNAKRDRDHAGVSEHELGHASNGRL
jgi:hypothetical protein